MSDHVVLHALVCALSWVLVEAAQAQVPSDTSEQGLWGDWGAAAYCPQEQYVWGFRLKSEPDQGSGDDTALNAMQVYCGL
ncbi:hypothetical protein [Pseudomonas sp. NFACC44-2]|uniref:hypothetical protein n=1 Tax=unclassified Pseudomonas TaxID=196821 RepID=UPI000B82EAB1